MTAQADTEAKARLKIARTSVTCALLRTSSKALRPKRNDEFKGESSNPAQEFDVLYRPRGVKSPLRSEHGNRFLVCGRTER